MLRLTFPPPVDFQRLLLDLQGLGLTGPQIQAASGVRRGAIGSYKSGECRPSFSKGEALIRVWCQRMGRSRDEVPRLAEQTISAAKIEREDRGPADAFAVASTDEAAASIFDVVRGWKKSGDQALVR